MQNVQIEIILRMRKASSRIYPPPPLPLPHSYILWYSIILFRDSEGPDQTALMRRLIWAFAVHMTEDTFFQGAAHITFNV